jgi:ABC-type uncharacterized transport system permease subunit
MELPADENQQQSSKPFQFGVRHLLVAVAVVSVWFALFKFDFAKRFLFVGENPNTDVGMFVCAVFIIVFAARWLSRFRY